MALRRSNTTAAAHLRRRPLCRSGPALRASAAVLLPPLPCQRAQQQPLQHLHVLGRHHLAARLQAQPPRRRRALRLASALTHRTAAADAHIQLLAAPAAALAAAAAARSARGNA